MMKYQKTYKHVGNVDIPKSKSRFKLAKITTIFVLDSIFSIAIFIKKILLTIILWFFPIIGSIIYKILFKTIFLPLYRLIFSLTLRNKHIFVPHSNKFFFLFSNRYVTHTVAVLIILITIAQNVSTRSVRAEDFGKTSLFAELTKGQYLTEEIIEEEIILPEMLNSAGTDSRPKHLEYLSPGVTKKIRVTEHSEQTANSTALAQGGSAIIKPNLTETMDTPKIRETAITYTVQTGDSVFAIAEEFRISVNTILWANKLSSRSIIRPGDKLKILPVSGVQHTVKGGETISSIAAKFNIPQSDILEVNNLDASSTIASGLQLIIPEGRPLYVPRPRRRIHVATTRSSGSDSGDLFWPTTCRRITQYYKGWRHTGIDIACGLGKNIYSAGEGVIEKAGWNSGGYGNRIIIKHSDGTKTLYAHLRSKGILVSVGQYVKKGELIGYMGSTGRSTGPHLHFEVIIKGSRINPFNRL